MKKYIVNYENRSDWNNMEDINDESAWVVTESEIKELAAGWGKEVEELMEHVEEVEE